MVISKLAGNTSESRHLLFLPLEVSKRRTSNRLMASALSQLPNLGAATLKDHKVIEGWSVVPSKGDHVRGHILSFDTAKALPYAHCHLYRRSVMEESGRMRRVSVMQKMGHRCSITLGKEQKHESI